MSFSLITENVFYQAVWHMASMHFRKIWKYLKPVGCVWVLLVVVFIVLFICLFSPQTRIVGKRIAVCRKLGCFIALSLIKRGSFKNALKINLKYIFPQRLISRQGTLCKLFFMVYFYWVFWFWLFFRFIFKAMVTWKKISISERLFSFYTSQNLYAVLWDCVQYWLHIMHH